MVEVHHAFGPIWVETYCYCCSVFAKMQLFHRTQGLYLALCLDCVKKLNSHPELDPYTLRQEIREGK